MISETEILKQVSGIFVDVLDNESIVLKRETIAKDVEEWDSLTHISLMVAVEKAFGVRFRVGEVENAKNIGEFSELILKRKHEA